MANSTIHGSDAGKVSNCGPTGGKSCLPIEDKLTSKPKYPGNTSAKPIRYKLTLLILSFINNFFEPRFQMNVPLGKRNFHIVFFKLCEYLII
jgi:hypothetical protein